MASGVVTVTLECGAAPALDVLSEILRSAINRCVVAQCADWFAIPQPEEPSGPRALACVRPMPNAWGR